MSGLRKSAEKAQRVLQEMPAKVTVSEGAEITPTHEAVAKAFHGTYEDLAPQFGWETQERSRTNWDDVPGENRDLMVAVVASLHKRGVIEPGPAVDPARTLDPPRLPTGGGHL